MFSKEGEWYPDHILSWYPYRNDDNVLFLMYEEMKKVSLAVTYLAADGYSLVKTLIIWNHAASDIKD